MPATGSFERNRAVEFAILAFVTVGAPYVLTMAAGSALFLSAYGGEALAWIYLCVAALTALIAWAFLRLRRRMSLRRLSAILIVARVVIALALAAALSLSEQPEAAFVAAVWARVDFVLGGVAFWALAGRRFEAGEARVWFPVFAGCEALAILLVGLLIPQALIALAPAHLFLGAAISLCLGLPWLLFPDAEQRAATARPTRRSGVDAPSRPLSRSLNRYLGLILSLAVAGTLAHYLVDNLFYLAAADSFAAPAALASFISYTLAAAGLFSLLIAAYGARRAAGRFAADAGLLSLPLILAGLAALVIAFGLGLASATPAIVMIAAMKVAERAVLAGVYRPAFQSLYQPFPDAYRAGAVERAEGVAQPASAALASVLLLVAFAWLQPTYAGLAGAALALCLVWAVVTMVTRRAYIAALERALARRQSFDDATIGAPDRKSREVIQRIIRRGDARDVIGASRVQAALDPTGFRQTAPRLIARGEGKVVRQLLTTVSEVARPEFYPPMYGRLSIEQDPEVRDALLTAVAATRHPNAPGLLAKAVADQPEAPPTGALIGLCRHSGPFGAAIAGRFIERKAQEGEAGLRLALEATVAIGRNAPSSPTALGLRAPNRAIRRIAIRAAGQLADPEIAPLLTERLADPRERRAARQSLSSMGPPAIEALAETAGDRRRPTADRAAAIMALGVIDAPEAQEHILRHFETRNLDLQGAAALALWRAGVIAPRDRTEALLGAARDLTRVAGEATLARLELTGADWDDASARPAALLSDALAGQADLAIAQAARAAGVLRPRTREEATKLSALFGEARHRDAALAAAGAMLPPDLQPLLALIHGDAAPDRVDRLRDILGNEAVEVDERLAVLAADTPWASDWTRGLAFRLFAARRRDMLDDLSDALEGPGPVLTDELARIGVEERGGPDMGLSTIETVLILRATDLFSQVPDEDLAEIAPTLTSLYLDPGEVVIREGEIGDELYILVTGEVVVTRDGREVARRRDGSVFGDLAALDPEPRAATVTTSESSHVLALSNEHLMALLESNVEIAAGLIATLVRRLRAVETY